MPNNSSHKTIIIDFIQAVWREGNLDALPTYWTSDCINHAMPGDHNTGLDMLRA
jgi:hypothetical protein